MDRLDEPRESWSKEQVKKLDSFIELHVSDYISDYRNSPALLSGPSSGSSRTILIQLLKERRSRFSPDVWILLSIDNFRCTHTLLEGPNSLFT